MSHLLRRAVHSSLELVSNPSREIARRNGQALLVALVRVDQSESAPDREAGAIASRLVAAKDMGFDCELWN
jgi:hypothetical protein